MSFYMLISIKAFTQINGMFDILCSTGILLNIRWISWMHLSIFKHYDIMHRRFLAYWILNYGLIRLFSNDLQLIESSSQKPEKNHIFFLLFQISVAMMILFWSYNYVSSHDIREYTESTDFE